MHENYVSLALVNNEIVQIPYYSNIGGITILEWDAIPYVSIFNTERNRIDIEISPNPADNLIQIQSNLLWQDCDIIDVNGRAVKHVEYTNSIDCINMENGLYLIRFLIGNHN